MLYCSWSSGCGAVSGVPVHKPESTAYLDLYALLDSCIFRRCSVRESCKISTPQIEICGSGNYRCRRSEISRQYCFRSIGVIFKWNNVLFLIFVILVIIFINFRHSTFTCNMHAFGLPRNLCLEFLRKQCIIANLTQGNCLNFVWKNHSKINKYTNKWKYSK